MQTGLSRTIVWPVSGLFVLIVLQIVSYNSDFKEVVEYSLNIHNKKSLSYSKSLSSQMDYLNMILWLRLE